MNINVPIGDFHYNGHKILLAESDCAKYLDKYRINLVMLVKVANEMTIYLYDK